MEEAKRDGRLERLREECPRSYQLLALRFDLDTKTAVPLKAVAKKLRQTYGAVMTAERNALQKLEAFRKK